MPPNTNQLSDSYPMVYRYGIQPVIRDLKKQVWENVFVYAIWLTEKVKRLAC